VEFAAIMRAAAVDPSSVPDGWSLVAKEYYVGTSYACWVYSRVCVGGEGTSTWTWAASSRTNAVIFSYYDGIDTDDPIDAVSNTSYKTSNTTIRAASADAAVSGEPAIWVSFAGYAAEITVPSGYTENGYSYYTPYIYRLKFGSTVLSSAGATGDVDGAIATATDSKHAFLILLNPPAAPSTDLLISDASHALTSDAVTIEAVAGATSLAISDAAHSLASDAVALTQSHALEIANAAHTLGSDAVTLGQAHALAVASASHTLSSDAVTLSTAHVLAIADATHAHTAGSVAITQTHVLAVADAAHALTSDAVTVSEGVAATLAIADASHALTSDAVALTQTTTLAIADASHGLSSGTVALTQAHALTIADAVEAVFSDAVTVTQAHVLAIADALHALTSEGVGLRSSRGLLKVHTAASALSRGSLHRLTRSSVTRRR
jgi:hypothetical protein